MSERKLHFETLQLHVGQEQADPVTDSRAVPIYQTTSYVFHSAQHAADRFSLRRCRQHLRPPDQLHRRMSLRSASPLSRAALLPWPLPPARLPSPTPSRPWPRTAATSSPRRPSTAAPPTCWSTPCPPSALTTTFVDAHDLAEVEGAIQDNTRAIYLETLGNPNSDIPDIDAIAEIAHKHGLPLVIDNTFGTPYLIRPIEHGADIVVHSATKFIGGHGTTLGGIIVDSGKFDWKASGKYPCVRRAQPQLPRRQLRRTPPAPPPSSPISAPSSCVTPAPASAPFNAFLLLQGTETLSLRLDRHVENTKKVVEYLQASPQGGAGQPSQPAGPSRPRPVREVLPQRRRVHLHLRHQGRPEGSL